MKKNLPFFVFFLACLLPVSLQAQDAPGCIGCRTKPVCSLEKNSIMFDYLGASEQASGNTQLRFTITNMSQFPLENVTFELPGKNIPANAPMASYIGRYHYAVQNPYADSLIKFTGLNTATYRYDQGDQFRYEVNSALLRSADNMKIQIQVKAGDISSTVVFDLENCAKKPVITLPVELISFKGVGTDQGVALTWVTASEKDCAYFTVQHSSDGSLFEAVGKLSGNGNSLSEKTYKFTHPTPLNGKNFYRLKQVDVDDSFRFSPIILVDTNKLATPGFSIYPNPATENKFYIWLENKTSPNQTVRFWLSDLTGKTLLEQDFKARQEILVDLAGKGLPAGLYLVKVQQGESQQLRKVIIE